MTTVSEIFHWWNPIYEIVFINEWKVTRLALDFIYTAKQIKTRREKEDRLGSRCFPWRISLARCRSRATRRSGTYPTFSSCRYVRSSQSGPSYLEDRGASVASPLSRRMCIDYARVKNCRLGGARLAAFLVRAHAPRVTSGATVF